MNGYRNRLLFTMGGAAVYVLGRFIRLPGIDHQRVMEFLSVSDARLIGVYSRELTSSAVFSLGITPLVLGSVLILLLAGMVSRLRQLRDAPGEAGAALDRPIYIATIVIALLQGWALALMLELIPGALRSASSLFLRIQTAVVLVAGAVFLAWLAGQITRRGLVNGVALIVLIGALAEVVSGLKLEIAALVQGVIQLRPALYFLILVSGLFALSIFMVKAEHRIPLKHGDESSWSRGDDSGPSIVLRMNMVGVIPIILAGIVMLPLNYLVFTAGSATSWVTQAVLIAGFTYLATAVSFSGADVVRTVRRYGFFLADVDRSDAWEEYLDRTVERLVARHAAFLVALGLVEPLIVARLGIGPWLSWLAGPALLVLAAIGVALVENGRPGREAAWVPVFEADTELEVHLARSLLQHAGIFARRVSNRAIAITGTLAFWETSRPPYPGLTIYRRLGGGGVYLEVPADNAQQAESVLTALTTA